MTLPGPQCLACDARLPEAHVSQDRLACTACGASYPVHFGIVDLRAGQQRVAGAEFDMDRDLEEAKRLEADLQGVTYRDWFFAGVDRKVAHLADPRFRALMTKYYRDERSMFGQHGDAILTKVDAYLSEKEPERYARWRTRWRTALEAGCGTGQYPLGFARRFDHVLVTDISYVSLVQARKIADENGLTNVTLFASSIERLPIPAGSVDFVHCNGVIEHVAQPDRAIAECGRVLSEEGIALVLSANRYSLYLEAHFRVLAFGFWPPPLRRWLARRFSGATTFAGTELRSLSQLRRWATSTFAHHRIYFLPPRLPRPVRGGLARRFVYSLSRGRLTRGMVDLLLNGLFLGIAPYHVMVGFKR